MWGASEEPPGTMEGGPPEPAPHVKEKCEQNKNQLESLKEIMLKNKQSLKKKEEEVQEYARRLSKIKSRAKLSRRSKEGAVTSTDTTQLHKPDAMSSDIPEESIDDISQAKTPKAKSTLLQKKLAENRKAFEQRSKEMTETKRAVEEKVEAIRQQLEEKDAAISALQKDQLTVTPIRPVVVTSDIMSPIQIGNMQEKENKIAELRNRILELEASVLDLQENLKEKDSVIESKTRAVTLMSADLSRKGKTTLDTLEDTKDEMRTMQEHFVLLETSLKNKNESLLDQLQERDNKITDLHESIESLEKQLSEQKLSETASADFSRSTMDALVETKDNMKSMQENFVLIETALKAKNDNLLQQLQDYELKLAEANERVFKLESGVGIIKDPKQDDLEFKIEKLEQTNKQLQDEKYELQKNISEMQDKIINRSVHGNGAIMEKDNRIAELENLVEELKQSNTLLEEESKAELQKQLADITLKNEEYSNKITDLEKLVNDLEAEKNDAIAKIPDENSTTKESEKVAKLTKELEELNKSMIKIKAQHRSKLKNQQKQLENFKMVSDTNAELVRLGNQVALLEEEKGNLQLSLVDFDELKASAGDWQERIAELESKVSAQTNEIQMHIEAIATLENQKLDLMQELHTAKQEVSTLEAENAESENLRVTAEMKVVDLEEQLEAIYKGKGDNKTLEVKETNKSEFLQRIEVLTQENSELYSKIAKLEEKSSDTGSTGSFEAIQESDKNDLLKKVQELTEKNNELTVKLNKFEEKSDSHAGSTESFETINDLDKTEMMKKIDQLTQENVDLTMKLSRFEEKGSSDTGSTESFERIPEHNESMTKIELLTQENNELVIKLTKLEEQLESIKDSRVDASESDGLKLKMESLLEENNSQSSELSKLRAQVQDLIEDNANLEERIKAITRENHDLVIMYTKSEERLESRSEKMEDLRLTRETQSKDQIETLIEEKSLLEKEIRELRNELERFQDVTPSENETSELKTKIEELSKENARVLEKISELEESNKDLKDSLNKVTREREELQTKINQLMPNDDFAKERLELIDRLERINQEKKSVAQERQELHEQISTLLHKSAEESPEIKKSEELISPQTESMIVSSLEREIEECKRLIAEQTSLIEEMKIKLADKERELEKKGKLIVEYETSGKKAEELEEELKDMLNTIEEWQHKCSKMQEQMAVLEAGKASIEEGFRKLESEKETLLVEQKEKDKANDLIKQQLEDTVANLESNLHEKYTQLQNEMIFIDNLQEELNSCKALLQQKDTALSSLSVDVDQLNESIRSKDEEIHSLKKEVRDLHESIRESKSLEEYNELLEHLRNKDMFINELQCKIDDSMKENKNVLMKMENLTQHSEEVENQLSQKQHEMEDLLEIKRHLQELITETERGRNDAERRVSELEHVLEDNSKFVEGLQAELNDAYKKMEELNAKHIADIEMQVRKFETVNEELQGRTQELELLKNELQEKERLVGQNMTEEMKVSLEATVAALQKELSDAKDKIQAQLEKMKKIAANLKKKTVICQELEARVAELEEKWTTEKDEKEVKNKKIQEVESLMREKDNKIADLEEKLLQAGNELTDANVNMEKLTNDITTSKEKLASLVEQITELEEENTKLRTDINSFVNELQSERESKENVQLEYDSFRQQVFEENERTQLELDDVKEKARELSVRMQVMESEYVEQLTLINNLRAENGLLLSKQAQINEKLENTEKESDDRRIIIEKIQKEAVETVSETTQTSEPCDNCEQWQTLVQTLEAKLQEREAEIEKLDNELANSNHNFVQMHAALRMNDAINESSIRNMSLEDTYNELLMQYNALVSNNEEMKTKLEDTLKENDELMQKIESLQSINSTLEERISSVIQELEEGKVIIEKLQTNDTANVDINKKYEAQQIELSNVEKELHNVRERCTQLDEQLNSGLFVFETEKQELTGRIKSLSDTADRLEQEIESLKTERDLYQQRMTDLENELKTQKEESSLGPFASNHSRDEQDSKPQLFDASKIFGAPTLPDSDILANKEVSRLHNLLAEKESQCFNLTQEIENLQKLMIEEKSQLTENYNRCSEELQTTQEYMRTARVELERLEFIIIEKDRQMSSLNLELNNRNDTDVQFEAMTFGRDNQIEELSRELNITKEKLESVIIERDQQMQLLESYKLQTANLEAEVKNMTDTELIQDLEQRISVTQQERDLLQLQVNDLSMSMQELKDSLDYQRNIQNELENAVRERDEAKEAAANLTRTLEEYYKTSKVTDNQIVAQKSLDETTASTTQEKLLQPVEENIKQATRLDIGSAWDSGSNEKLNVDEETWGWNDEDVQLAGDQQITTKLIPSEELQLRTKIEDLEDRIKDLESQREKILEENKVAQARSGKMIKKLKEYKVQVESLQQQLKMQKSTGDFYNLDSAIEEELKSQITALEKSLSSLKEEHKRSIAEKEALSKRLDNITSSNERYAEINERQEMDMEVLRIQNRELNNKIQILNERLQVNANDSEHKEEVDNPAKKINQPLTHDQPHKRSIDNDEFEALSKKYKDEIDDLKDEMEALASENEQLQQFLEEQKLKMSSLESKDTDADEAVRTIDTLNNRITELEGTLSKTKDEYDVLRKQYEQSLMDANDQVSAMRQNTDLMQAETFEKISKLEMEVNKLQQQVEGSATHADELQRRLNNVLQEKAVLEEKISALSGTEEKLSSVNLSLAEVTDLLNIRVQEVVDLKQELQRQYIDREESEGRLQTFVQALTQEVKEKKQELENLKQSFTDKEKEFIQQQSLETASAIVSEATQELVQKHTAEIEEKDKEIRNLIDKISKLQSTLDGHSLQTQSDVERYHSQEKNLELLQETLIEKDSILESIQFNFLQTKEELNQKESELSRSEEELQNLKLEVQKYLAEINDLQRSLNESQATITNVDQQSIRIENLEREVDDLRSTLLEKEAILDKNNEDQKIQLETYEAEVTQLRADLEEMKVLKNELREKTDLINNLNSELNATRRALEETRKALSEKISLLEHTNQQLNEKQQHLSGASTSESQQVSTIVDGLPLFRMADDNTEILPNTADDLRAELEKKQQEIEHLKYVLNENTYPSIIGEMQDRINCLYNEKSELESSLAMASQTLTVKEKQVDDLRLQIEMQSREIRSKEELNLHKRERRSLQDEEEVVRLQNELHVKEQEINELKYIIAEKDSQLAHQASMEPQSDDFELREMVQRLTTELYGKEQEVQQLKMTITEFQREVSRLQEFEILTTESREAIHRLTSEKEHVRLEAEEHLERILREKEMEIGEIKQRLQVENQKLLDELQLRENDVQNLMRQIQETSLAERHANDRLHEKEDELLRVNTDLAEKERRLAELSITKDTELHNLKVQIHEKEVRIEELLALSEEEEKQLVELRNTLDARETEVNALKKLLEDKVAEYEVIQHALRKDVPLIDTSSTQGLESASGSEAKEHANQELDLALYMLHQRDVRCEELTHELMQLLEERDTLQLRLSNAIRINEELRRTGNTDLSLQKEVSTSSATEEPLVEHPSPSRSEGPVEIAKEAIDSPISEDKEALAQKLSQLHTMSYAKDVRLKDERELRHTQQMSLLAHKDVLSTLPPEAAARLVNANYTLSRDVQSQSSVLLNWLWGKREYGNVSQV